MAILHIDGFDHYGTDTARMIEGAYDQVDAAFTLSEANPRTGARCLRRDDSAQTSIILRGLNSQNKTIGTGIAVHLSSLPSQDNAFILCDLRDSNGDVQLEFLVQSDGAIVARNPMETILAQSSAGVVQSSQYVHIELAVYFDFVESSEVLTASYSADFDSTLRADTSDDVNAPSDNALSFTTNNTDIVRFTLPSGQTYEAWNAWSIVDLPERGWLNYVFYKKDGATASFTDQTRYATATEARQAFGTKELTGAQQYDVYIADSILSDNEGGISILAEVYSVTQENPQGIIEVRVNGVTVISEPGLLTAYTGNEECGSVALHCGGSVTANVITDIEDWFVWNNDGAWNNSFLGDRRCYLLKPNQDTNIADFDPSSGSFGYKMIDDDLPDDDSTYIIAEAYLQSGSPLTGTSEFEIEDLPDGTSLISAVNVVIRASKTDSTSAEVFTSINSGVNTLSEDAHTLTTSYRYFNDVFEFDPTTIASLTKDGFNALTVSVTAGDLDSGESLGGSPPAESPSDEPPAAPSSLISARDGGYSAAFVTWVDNSNNETGFELQYDTDVGFGSPTTVNPAANATIHRVSGLTRGQTYYFRIRAVNGAGSSAWSNTDSATIFQLSDVTLYAEYDANAGVFQDSGTTPVASDGDPVGQVHDQTGNGRHITQTTASAKPVWKTNQLNGLPVIRNDVGDMLQAATAADWKFMHDGTQFAVFIVWKTAATGPDAVYNLVDTGANSAADTGFSILYDDRSTVPRNDRMLNLIARGSGGLFATSITEDYVAASNAWHIHAPRFTGASMENFSDGQFSKSIGVAPSGAPSASNPTSALTVGARYNNTTNLVGDWARILIVNGTLSNADHRAIQDYLSETYQPFNTKFFGSETVVQHDTSGLDHNGFAGLGLADNGDLIIGYSKNTSHASQDGKLVYRISSDRGATWGAEQTLWDYSTDGGGTDLWFTPRFTTLSDGRIMMAVGLRVSQTAVVDGIGYFESSDNGQTWAGPNQRTEAVFDNHAGEGGGIIELSNGNLLYPYFGRDAADASNRRSSAVLQSTDGGATWTALATIGDGPADGKDYVEPGIFQADNGDVVAMIREDVAKQLYISRSTDSGATWTTPVLHLPDVSGLMTPLKLASGAVIAPQRDNDVSGQLTEIVFSQNGGVTWQKGRTFAASPNMGVGTMIYGQFQEDSNGRVYLAYAYENGAKTAADIMFVKSD